MEYALSVYKKAGNNIIPVDEIEVIILYNSNLIG